MTRSPEWQRPKKRGVGSTVEKGAVRVRERIGGRWEGVTGRADEAGLLLQDLLGMRLDQFTTVVLLPQGEFAAFLRADAESRRGLLEQLFATGRFSDVEAWLAEQRREVGRSVARVQARTDELLARADEHVAHLAGAGSLPAQQGAPEQPAQPSHSRPDGGPQAPSEGRTAPAAGRRSPGLDQLADTAAALAELAAQEAERASAAAEATHAALTAGRQLARRQEQAIELAARAASLLEGEAEQEVRRRRIADGRRVAPILPLLLAAGRQQADLEECASVLEAVRLAVPAPLAQAGRLAIESARVELGKELGRLAEARETRDALLEHRAAGAEATALEAAATRSAAAAKTELEAVSARRTAALARRDQTAASAGTRAGAESALADAERVRRAVTARSGLETTVQGEAVRVRGLQEAALTAKEHWLALREQRLAGIAAELAAGLVSGAPCPVCGAHEHPAPAPVHPDGVTKAAELAAQDAVFDAEQALASARENLALLQAGLAEESARAAGLTVTGARAGVAAAKAQLAAAADAAERLPAERKALEALDGQIEELTRLAEQLLRDAAVHAASARASAVQAERLAARLDTARGQDEDLDAREQRLQSELAALGTLLDARDRHDQLAQLCAAALEEGEAAWRAAGFDDLAAVRAAVVPDEELADLERAAAAYDEQLAAVRAMLAEPDLLEAAQAPAPDLAALEAAEAGAAARRRQAEQEHARVEAARAALTRLAAELREHEEANAPLLARSALVDDLARCVEGSGGDNVLRMRLSSYVLAARLEEVAAAATERLLVMSDGRYSLVHTDALARGGVRSGLGLRVVDGWTGVERDTATLSGGESFLASLALALGLADAVQAEAGGAVMETLFIDEGFGMLDEDTLDEVMTVLDGLREGGRAVGLVSHVADLRARIPAQLEVRKARTGSRIVLQEQGAA